MARVDMADVSGKKITARRARAVGSLKMGPKAFRLLKAGKLPKGDAISLAQAAGISAAKKTPDLLPLCHPISLDAVTVDVELDPKLPGARVSCVASIEAKTGVEMEALTGVSAALLCLYDLLKPIDPALLISDVRLDYKLGGKKGLWKHPSSATAPKAPRPPKLGRAAVITVSDRASKGAYKDRSGPILVDGLRSMGFTVKAPSVVPDDFEVIESAIIRASRSAVAVILTGGTGLSSRDVTPEAVVSVSEKLVPGIAEALRGVGPLTAPLSRSVAGTRGRCLIVSVPGSTGGARDAVSVLSDLLPHAIHVLRDGDHR